MEEERSYRGHVMVLPYQGQGHMNPILQFCKRLSTRDLKITVATTVSVAKSLQSKVGSSITVEPIYDDFVEGDSKACGGFNAFMDKFEAIGSRNLEELIKKEENSKYPIKCLVYDANLQWSLEVAKGLGILGAAFFTQSCAAIYSYYKMVHGDKMIGGPESSMPDLDSVGLPQMKAWILKFSVEQFSNLDKADWVVKWMSKMYPVRTIGPTIPSMYLDKRIQDDKDYGFNLFKPTEDACTNWLNTKEPGTVVYVSFGSAASLGPEQMEELAWGLKESETHFLWVVRASEEVKLPKNFLEETSEKGLLVNWCSQLEVLSHEAVGCFMTHCGWNSTIEGVSLGVPMVAMPQFLDQFSGAKFVEEVWEMGIKVKVDEKGIVGREEIGRCIKEVMNGERAEEIKRNASKWRELAKDAVDEGGNSDNNIEEIVSKIVCN
ncbi:UDP-glucuronosyl/UDP-glucosyltransferase [Macleaya cordata]|uniref:Glycosyltransferase n=1 Tax=Macleaya cordata TaxID=56857 RepID=A0A200QC78_MACCD|nr:UDP-glucuronosyl/UDP-glucosyltransferase [Macleaya cordata]